MIVFIDPANANFIDLVPEFMLYLLIVLFLRLLFYGADLLFLKKKKQTPNLFIQNDHLRQKLYENQKIKTKYLNDPELLSLLKQLETNNATALHRYVNTWSKVRLSFFQAILGSIPLYFAIRWEWDESIITYLKNIMAFF